MSERAWSPPLDDDSSYDANERLRAAVRAGLREFVRLARNDEGVRSVRVPLQPVGNDRLENGSLQSVDSVGRRLREGEPNCFRDAGSGSAGDEVSLNMRRVRDRVIKGRPVVEIDFQVKVTFMPPEESMAVVPIPVSGSCRVDRKTGAVVSMNLG